MCLHHKWQQCVNATENIDYKFLSNLEVTDIALDICFNIMQSVNTMDSVGTYSF